MTKSRMARVQCIAAGPTPVFRSGARTATSCLIMAFCSLPVHCFTLLRVLICLAEKILHQRLTGRFAVAGVKTLGAAVQANEVHVMRHHMEFWEVEMALSSLSVEWTRIFEDRSTVTVMIRPEGDYWEL